MAWTDPRTWVTGEVVTAAIGNQHWRDNLRYLEDLAYVEFTSNVSITGTSFVDVVSSGPITYEAAPIVIEFSCVRFQVGASGGCNLHLRDGATDLGQLVVGPTSSQEEAVLVMRRLTPTAASHTYVISGKNAASQTSTVHVGAGGAATNMPGFIRVRGIPT